MKFKNEITPLSRKPSVLKFEQEILLLGTFSLQHLNISNIKAIYTQLFNINFDIAQVCPSVQNGDLIVWKGFCGTYVNFRKFNCKIRCWIVHGEARFMILSTH